MTAEIPFWLNVLPRELLLKLGEKEREEIGIPFYKPFEKFQKFPKYGKIELHLEGSELRSEIRYVRKE